MEQGRGVILPIRVLDILIKEGTGKCSVKKLFLIIFISSVSIFYISLIFAQTLKIFENAKMKKKKKKKKRNINKAPASHVR